MQYCCCPVLPDGMVLNQGEIAASKAHVGECIGLSLQAGCVGLPTSRSKDQRSRGGACCDSGVVCLYCNHRSCNWWVCGTMQFFSAFFLGGEKNVLSPHGER